MSTTAPIYSNYSEILEEVDALKAIYSNEGEFLIRKLGRVEVLIKMGSCLCFIIMINRFADTSELVIASTL